ncbi:MAG: hypothetical protein WBO68_11375, partial [Pyrinomonadaceae bacterium]
MQKNDKFYTFLLSQSSKKGVYIRRISISKSLIHFGSVGVFLFVGMLSLGIGVSGFVRTTAFAKDLETANVSTQLASVPPQQTQTIDYSRPNSGQDYSVNSGGPEDQTEDDAEDLALENQIRTI